jgi:starch-binding outer membrane protein, SusD/RagB family
MKKIKFLSVFAVITGLLLMHSCSEEFLEITPNASLDKTVLATYNGVDALLIGSYSMLDGCADGYGWEAASTGWVFGSIRGLEANKGTDSGDQPAINPIQTYTETATNGYLNVKWRSVYEGISRANTTIILANVALEEGTITQDEYDTFINQARALRGVYHFWAWKVWADRGTNTFVPYVDENTDTKTVTNDQDIRANIIADLEAGTNLPLDMNQIGRFNKTVVQVFLAKALMQMNGDYAAALTELNDVVATGTQPAGGEIGLAPLYGEIFNIENRNDVEAVYTVQYSVNDNSGGMNAGNGEVLNFPYKSGASPGGCCGFFNPTQEFVNSFRVDANGLPMLDASYNNAGEELLRDMGIPAGGIWQADDGDPETTIGQYLENDVVTVYDPADPYIDLAYKSLTGTEASPNVDNPPLTSPGDWELIWTEDNSLACDPRLDWAVGRRGIPYWDWGVHTGSDWIRDQTYSGPYSPKKQVYKKSQEGTFTEVGNWTSGYTANGYRMIRYADVLLLKAECEAQTSTDDLGFGEVNQIRARAANPDGFVYDDAAGTIPAANYQIAEYTTAFTNTADAMEKIMMERKLELGQEGHRYYDLQRWGNFVTEGNRILDYEKTMPWGGSLYGGATIGAEDVNFPVPQRQIDVSNGVLLQNR